jgi:hypothetical protein
VSSAEANDVKSARDAAREYAWKWFEYHAGQRQIVFRFYLIIASAISAGYISTENSTSFHDFSCLTGLLLAIFSVLFYKLDKRGIHLVKFSEEYLKIEEQRLNHLLNEEAILIVHKADGHNLDNHKFLYSFSSIYNSTFLLVGSIGLALFLLGVTRLAKMIFCHS